MMKLKKGISVIVPTYKRNRLLIDCLNSILQQTQLPNEVIIIDNANDNKLGMIVEKIKKNRR